MKNHLPLLTVALIALLFLATHAATASGFQPQGLGLGVNIHFTDNSQPGELDMLAKAGFRWVRMDFTWQGTEPAAGKYDFSHYDGLLASLDKLKIKPVFILDYGNPLYTTGDFPMNGNIDSPAALGAMSRWAAAAAIHFKGRGVIWEIWNEPNWPTFWAPKPDANEYATMALAVASAIKSAAPKEIVMGPTTARIDFPFIEACFKAGLLQYWDAVSVHPYRGTSPETAGPDYVKLHQLIDRYKPRSKTVPIFCSEWGYSSVTGGLSDETQGKYLSREWLTNLANGVGLSIWYDWRDDSTDPNDREDHFGTVGNAYNAGRTPIYDPKPAYLAAQTVVKMLMGYKFDSRLAVGDSTDYVLRFRHGKRECLVAWTATTESTHALTIPARAGTYSVTSYIGATLPPVTANAAGLQLTVDDGPLFLVRTGG